ncbi:hypothetical protein A1OE_1509 [Candidatus Endolissoclinum faulkneri L2]|uniref:Uncharacterized protein n=1 Tax=Candidatus Endolissoclinum faulkneri L2 TaxID=1193729 RepID=K7Z666_9PROT|nr:hypothetical protein A1OE_1509 [Candidatus Endolissoclinum faulkneri L2]
MNGNVCKKNNSHNCKNYLQQISRLCFINDFLLKIILLNYKMIVIL